MGNGKWREELPWELWELILDNLSAVDRLSCVTSTKVMMERYEKGSDLATLREEAREEVQTVREECYEQRVEEAVGYYMIHNVKLRQPGVCYRSVARQFRIGKPDLQRGVEIRRHGNDDEDSNACKKKLWKEGGKYETKGGRGAEKKSGGGPPDLSGAGSRDGCPRLKVLQVPKKKMPP